jgi:hypothetical protein
MLSGGLIKWGSQAKIAKIKFEWHGWRHWFFFDRSRMISDKAQERIFCSPLPGRSFLIFRRDMSRNPNVPIRMPLNHWDLNYLRTRKILTLFLETPTLVGLTEPTGGRMLVIGNTNGFLTVEKRRNADQLKN